MHNTPRKADIPWYKLCGNNIVRSASSFVCAFSNNIVWSASSFVCAVSNNIVWSASSFVCAVSNNTQQALALTCSH